MTLVVPLTEKTGAAAKQAQITSLAAVVSTAPHYQQSQQLLLQTQIELVNALVGQGKLNAGSLLTTAAVFARGVVPPNSALPILATVATLTTQVALGDPMGIKAANLAAAQAQAVSECLASGLMSPALVLSSQVYLGGGAQ